MRNDNVAAIRCLVNECNANVEAVRSNGRRQTASALRAGGEQLERQTYGRGQNGVHIAWRSVKASVEAVDKAVELLTARYQRMTKQVLRELGAKI